MAQLSRMELYWRLVYRAQQLYLKLHSSVPVALKHRVIHIGVN